MKNGIVLFAMVLAFGMAEGQISRIGHNIEYGVEASATVADGDYAPFWLTANRHGLSSINLKSGYVRASVTRDAAADSSHIWRVGYGIDLVVPKRYTSDFIVQQLYADIGWRMVSLSVGSKERDSELKNPELSSGGLTLSSNARPVPQVRLEIPDFWVVPGSRNRLAFRAHIAYGITTDGNWQMDFVDPSKPHGEKILFHSKALLWRIGNADKSPIIYTGGIEMAAQFGGRMWNLSGEENPVYLDHNLRSLWNMFIPGSNDAVNHYIEGNQLGSWHLRFDYRGKGWGVSFYGEHYFEDHSQMFLEYGWKDMLLGVEAQLPRNPIVSTFVYEHMGMMDQSGPIYYDKDETIPIQVSGTDGYYSHCTYSSWQHWGQVFGSPLVVSPIYNTDHTLNIHDNRITANHFGITGSPISELSYRMLLTHIRSLGTYDTPHTDPYHANYFLLSLTYKPRWCSGLSIEASYATNGGRLIGSSQGGMVTIRKTGFLRK